MEGRRVGSEVGTPTFDLDLGIIRLCFNHDPQFAALWSAQCQRSRYGTMSAFAEDKESDYGTVKKVRVCVLRTASTRAVHPTHHSHAPDDLNHKTRAFWLFFSTRSRHSRCQETPD